jgi:hypothetical protein
MSKRLTEDGIQTVLAAARDAGLLEGDAQYTSSLVADAPTTTIVVTADGRTTTVSAYALGFDPLPAETTDAEREAREKLSEFTTNVLSFETWLPESAFGKQAAENPLDRLQVVSQPFDTERGDPAIESNLLDWPLDRPIATMGEPYFLADSRCVVLTGEELSALVAVLPQANQLTRWQSDDGEYVLYLRPVLPHETGCHVQ